MNIKKTFIVLLLFFSFLFLNKINIFAARIPCSSKALSEQKNKANKLSFNYQLKYDEFDVHYYEVTVTNLSPGIEFDYGGITYHYDEGKTVYKLIPRFVGGNTLEFEIFSSYDFPCVGEKLGTKKITIPKYNIYSEYSECIEYEEFPMCHVHYEKEIKHPKYFYESLENYKKSLLAKETEKPEEKSDLNFWNILILLYLNNLFFSIPLTIIFVFIVVYYSLIKPFKNKRKIKIKIDL